MRLKAPHDGAYQGLSVFVRNAKLGLLSILALSVSTLSLADSVDSNKTSTDEPLVSEVTNRRLDMDSVSTEHADKSVMLAIAAVGENMVAVGERGLIVQSNDCGANWHQAKSPVRVTLTSVKFVDGLHGWAVGHGGVVLHTKDAGATWNKQLDGRSIAKIAMANAKEMMLNSPSNKARQLLEDAKRLQAEGADKPLFAVHFWNMNKGIVVGSYGLAITTDDGGNTWKLISEKIPNPKGLHIYGLWSKGDEIVMVGEQGLIVKSNDKALSFQAMKSPYGGSYFGISPIEKNKETDLIVYGLRGHAFRLSGTRGSFSSVNSTVSAGILSMIQSSKEQALLFDADGQVIGLDIAKGKATVLGLSPVGPVVGAAQCGGKSVVVGFRGIASLDEKLTNSFKDKKVIK